MNGLYEAQNEHLFTFVDLDSSAKVIANFLAREAHALDDKSERESSLPKNVTIVSLSYRLFVNRILRTSL